MHGDDLEGAVSGRENEIRLLSTLQHFISSFFSFLIWSAPYHVYE